MKICAMCGEFKAKDKFRKYKHNVNNKIYIHEDSYCIDCRRLYDKEQHRIKRARKKDLKEAV